MRIHEVAARTGLSIHAIRFYEQSGVLDENLISRSKANYREYDQGILENLRVVKFSQKAGFTIHEIADMMQKFNIDTVPTTHKIAALEAKLAQVTQRAQEIDQVKQLIVDKLNTLRKPATR